MNGFKFIGNIGRSRQRRSGGSETAPHSRESQKRTGIQFTSLYRLINEEWLMKLLAYLIEDKRIQRMAKGFFSAGLEENESVTISDDGAPQDAIVSTFILRISTFILPLSSGLRKSTAKVVLVSQSLS